MTFSEFLQDIFVGLRKGYLIAHAEVYGLLQIEALACRISFLLIDDFL